MMEMQQNGPVNLWIKRLMKPVTLSILELQTSSFSSTKEGHRIPKRVPICTPTLKHTHTHTHYGYFLDSHAHSVNSVKFSKHGVQKRGSDFKPVHLFELKRFTEYPKGCPFVHVSDTCYSNIMKLIPSALSRQHKLVHQITGRRRTWCPSLAIQGFKK